MGVSRGGQPQVLSPCMAREPQMVKRSRALSPLAGTLVIQVGICPLLAWAGCCPLDALDSVVLIAVPASRISGRCQKPSTHCPAHHCPVGDVSPCYSVSGSSCEDEWGRRCLETFCIWAPECSKKWTQWEISQKNIDFWLLLTNGRLGNHSVPLTLQRSAEAKKWPLFRMRQKLCCLLQGPDWPKSVAWYDPSGLWRCLNYGFWNGLFLSSFWILTLTLKILGEKSCVLGFVKDVRKSFDSEVGDI